MNSVLKTLHPYEMTVLFALEGKARVSVLTNKTDLQEIQLKRAVEWLSNKELITFTHTNKKEIILGENGLLYKTKGLPEERFLQALTKEFIPVTDIEKKAALENGELNIVIGTLKKKGAVDILKEGGLQAKITDLGETLKSKESPESAFLQKDFPISIDSVKDLDKLAYDTLSKRKDIVAIDETKDIELELTTKGKAIKKELQNVDLSNMADKLTPEMLKTGSWKDKEFRHFDVESKVPYIVGGKRHFVNQAIEYMKQIWVELGFEEMSGNLCQTGFWDLDTLFVPQDHPARQMQDSFFIKDHKSKGILKGSLPQPLADTVAKVHESGGDTGSKGWGGKFSHDFSSEVMLRTHTTVVSAQYIHQHLKRDANGKIIPAKFFSVNKVFRNETPDWKHLFEFNQIEGIVVDPDANFQHLLGYLKTFFKKMGFSDVRIRPGHFPYTEPSAEFDVYNPKKKEWVELGGSGIFRPEVTKTLIGEEVPVLAWGLGMERIIVEYFELKDLRDLYKNDSKQLKQMKVWSEVSE